MAELALATIEERRERLPSRLSANLALDVLLLVGHIEAQHRKEEP